MSKFTFQKAVKRQEKLRLALDGPPGGGKTMTALIVATSLAAKEGGRVAVVDSERSSARKYANLFDFDHLTLPDKDPQTYTDAIKAAIEAEYAAIIVDSLSHAWEGTLDLKDKVTRRSATKDGFGAWREVTPIHEELVDTMLRAPAHVIVTMRTKMAHDYEKDDDGKLQVKKLGLKPVQRDGVDYEFDVVGDLDQENTLVISKTRCPELRGQIIRFPGASFAETLWTWLQDGEPPVAPEDLEWIKTTIRSIEDPEDRRVTAEMATDLFGKADELTAGKIPEFRTWLTERVEALRNVAADSSGYTDQDADHEPVPPSTTEPSPPSAAVACPHGVDPDEDFCVACNPDTAPPPRSRANGRRPSRAGATT